MCINMQSALQAINPPFNAIHLFITMRVLSVIIQTNLSLKNIVVCISITLNAHNALFECTKPFECEI